MQQHQQQQTTDITLVEGGHSQEGVGTHSIGAVERGSAFPHVHQMLHQDDGVRIADLLEGDCDYVCGVCVVKIVRVVKCRLEPKQVTQHDTYS